MLNCLISSQRVSCLFVKNMDFAICNVFSYYSYSIIQTGKSLEWGLCWRMFSFNKAEEWTTSSVFIIDFTDVFVVCNMNAYGLLVELESKLHFLLSFLKMKLGLMKGTGSRLWGFLFLSRKQILYITRRGSGSVKDLKVFLCCLSLLLHQLGLPIGKLTLCKFSPMSFFWNIYVKIHNNAVCCSFIDKNFCSLQSNVEIRSSYYVFSSLFSSPGCFPAPWIWGFLIFQL